MNERALNLVRIALELVSMPVNLVNAERSLSVYKYVVGDRRHNQSE